jgi:YD repeat-containing protein
MTMQLPATGSTRVIDDAVRGRRVIQLDAAGRPVRIDFADGTAWRIGRDADAGLTIHDEADRLLLGFEQRGPDRGACLGLREQVIARSPDGLTTVETGPGFQRIGDDAGMLRIDLDDDGDPGRVTLPGEGDELVYRGRGGTRVIAWLHAADLLRIVDADGTLRVDADGAGWTEEHTRTGTVWRTIDGVPFAELSNDASGRPARRTWHGTAEETFERDAAGRLTRWTRVDARGAHAETRRYTASGEPTAIVRDDDVSRISSGAGGRITCRTGSDPAFFAFDPQGRRTRRSTPTGQERYAYDGLGRLVRLSSEQPGDVRFGWDALGRRTWIETPQGRVREHRDTSGRQWAVTDAAGRRLWVFLWWRGRPLARVGADGTLDELYVTDDAGTLLGVLVRETDGGWRREEAMQPPFGAVGAAWRPTLFGHIADGSSRLIVFGARVYDPDTATFLTPDPWHGGEDDPRRLGGLSAGEVRRQAELPSTGQLAYALSRWDPLSRPDFDGHAAWVNGILTVILAPTWGFPLTSVSLFLFEPLNLYMEIIGLFGMLFTGGTHPWKQHTIANARWLAGSSRQGTAAFALNGFLPRVVSGRGIDTDRAVTIGHVIWIGRQNVEMLNRTRVLEVDELGLPRAPGAAPGPDPTTTPFTDGSVRRSALAVSGTDDGRLRIQGTWWSRGPGNRVDDLAAGVQVYNDDVPPGEPRAPGTVHLTAPLQTALKGTLSVAEYVEAPPAGGAGSTRGDLTSGRGFALDVSGTAALAAGPVVEVALADNAATAAYGHIAAVLPPRTIVLDHALPLGRFPAGGANPAYAVREMMKSAVTSVGWAAAGAPALEATLATPPHDVAKGEVWGFTPTTPAAGGRAESVSQVSDLRIVVELAPAVGAAAAVGTKLSRLAAEGTLRDATLEADRRLLVKAPPALAPGPGGANPPAATPLAVGDLITVLDAPTTLRHDAVIVAVEAAGADSRIRIDPLVPAGSSVTSVVRLHETDADKDAATITALAGDRATVGPRSTAVFAPDTAVRVVDAGGAAQVRRVASIGDVTVIVVDELVGTGPFSAVRYDGAATTTAATVPPGQFVKWTQGTLPSAFGNWPDEMLAVAPPAAERRMTWFAFRAGSLPAEAAGDFHATFTPLDVEADHYWHIDLPLKIDGSTTKWEPDREDDYPRRDTLTMSSTTLQFWQLQASPAERPAAGRAVTPRAGEVQVPEDPSARFPLGDALLEHELHHTVQNTYWGPLMGALPVWGLVRTIRDIVAVADADSGLWLQDWAKTIKGDDGKVDKAFADLNVFEFFSMGGLMQLAWTFVILSPLLPSAKAREWLLHRMQFADWNRVFNPVNSLIAKAIPRVDRTVDATRDWKILLANVVTMATDLRSWIPFIGFVPLLVPDGEQNFLEQQASRSSGDLYSTIVSANEGMSWIVTSRCGPDLYADNSDAQRSIRLGRSARLMWYGGSPKERATREGIGNAPTTHTSFTLMSSGTAISHLPAALFQGGATVQVDDPAGVPVPFATVAPGANAQIRLRAAVPEPRAVVRSTGFYLLPASPGQWTVNGGSGGPAQTSTAVITVTSDVTLGGEDVAWSPPIATGAGAVPAGTTTLDRFVTEKATLIVGGSDTSAWQATIVRAPGAGWEVAFTSPTPAGLGVASVDARLRIWAHVDPADAGIFDLEPQDLPGAGRSYLQGELWLPVRDVVVRVADLPALPAAAIAAADDHEVTFVVKMAGPGSIVGAGPGVLATRVGDAPPRGEKWKIGLKGRRAVADRTDVPVTETFGDATMGIVERAFTLTIDPNFSLPRKDGGAVFEATPGAPLVLSATAHSGGLTVAEQPPADAKASIGITGDDVTITVAAAPPAGPVTFDVVVKDASGRLAMRTVTVHA